MTTSDHGDTERGVHLSRTMVELADTLVHDFDVVAFLQMLSQRCVELFDLGSAGVMLNDPSHNLQVIASSDERGKSLELMEIQSQQGPCLDAFTLSQAIQATEAEAASRWPVFVAEARQLGFHSYSAVPLRLRDTTIGALNLFGTGTRLLGGVEIQQAQALADVATIGLLNERAVRESRLVAEQLEQALTSRVFLEQAKGILAVRLDCSVDDAFVIMRTYARRHGRRLTDLARGIVDGSIDTDTLRAR